MSAYWHENTASEAGKHAIHLWNKNRNLILDLDKLKLPDDIHKRNKYIITYCDLRINSYVLIYRAIQENDTTYNAG